MIERFIHHVRVELPDPAETAAGARTRLAERFPRPALRRMTHLGLLVGAALDGVAFGDDDALVYASTYSETRALEDYLASFPAPSPLLFQTSIHPGGVQQGLIGRQCPVPRLWCHAGRARLVEQALQSVLLENAPQVALAGGEERGTWMLERGIAAARPFAFAAICRRDAAGAIGRLAGARSPAADEGVPELEEFARSLAERRPLAWHGGGLAWMLEWR